MLALQKTSLSRSQLENILWVMFGFVLTLSLFLFTLVGLKRGYFNLAIFCWTIFLVYWFQRTQKYQAQVAKILLGISLCLVFVLAYYLAATYLHIPIWDFLCLYLFGKVGISGSNFY